MPRCDWGFLGDFLGRGGDKADVIWEREGGGEGRGKWAERAALGGLVM